MASCVVWGKNEIADKYILKGQEIYVEGSLNYRDYETNLVKKNLKL